MDPKTLSPLSNEDIRRQIDDLDKSIKNALTTAMDFERQAYAARAELSRLQPQLNALRNELDRRNRPAPEPRISDHALLRYIERVHQVDLVLLRESILTPSVIGAIQSGASAVTVRGAKFIIKDNVLVTVLGEDQRVKRKDAKRGRGIVDTDQIIEAGIAEYEDERGEQQAATS